MPVKDELAGLSFEELTERDQKLRKEGYALEERRQTAFEKHVNPIVEKIRENHAERDRLAVAISVQRQVETMSSDERKALAAALKAGGSDG